MQESIDIHMIAVGGTGMAPLACLLQRLGHRVRGSDGPLYPPMSTLLADAGIEPFVGYDSRHLEPHPDLVIVGNAVPRTNPEAEAVEAEGLERLSMPEAVSRFLLAGRAPLVIAGTHGKTTTTAIAAWVLTDCGTEPGYLIGGAPLNLPASFDLGTGRRFVIEGDEYNAAYFDRGPKFLHYSPQTLVLTSTEYDHADLYETPQDLLAAYRRLVELVPPDGLLVACGDSAQVREVAGSARCEVVFYGLEPENDVCPLDGWRAEDGVTRFTMADAEGETAVDLPLAGRHNVSNALAVWAVARRDGLGAASVARALGRFGGVARRMQALPSGRDVTVIDDFAHHPTAVRETLAALRQRFPGRRLVAVFEPRSLTAGRRFFHEAYLEAFRNADLVHLAPVFHAGRLTQEEKVDLGALARELTESGTPCREADSIDNLHSSVVAISAPGDVLVTMSSGSFEGLPHRLAQSLRDRS